MARVYSNNPADQGFPDEFGQDMYQASVEGCRRATDQAAPLPPPFWGYVVPGWFGPFLLSPRRRREVGWC